MAVVTSGNWQKGLWPGIANWFNQSYEAWEAEYPSLFTTRNSTKQFEQTVGMSLTGRAAIKGEGEGVKTDSTQQTYINQYDMQVRALGLITTWEAYEDNQYNLDALSRNPKALANSMRETKEVAGANVLNNGFSGSFTMGSSSDGVALFSAAHPSGPFGDNRDNLLTAADLSETSLEDACIEISLAKDPRGNQIKLMPQCLVVPSALNFVAGRILGSTLQNNTANNAINVLKSESSLPDGHKVNHYLTDTNAFFITTNINKAGEGLVHYNRHSLTFAQDNDFDTFNMKCIAYERYDFGWDEFQAIYGNAGS